MKKRNKVIAVLMSLMLVFSCCVSLTMTFVAADETDTETVCYIGGGEYYASLQDAINAASDNATITLTSDIEVDETITITGKTITLYLQNYTISASESFEGESLISLSNNGTANIYGGTLDAETKYLIYVGVNGTLQVLQSTTLSGDENSTIGIYLDGMNAYVSVISACTITNVYTGIKAYKCNPSGGSNGINMIGNTTIDASRYGIYLYMSKCNGIYNSNITGGWQGLVVYSNCGDYGYSTEVTVNNSTITGEESYAIWMGDDKWSGQGTLKVTLNGCTLSGAEDIAAYTHIYVDSVDGIDYEFSYTNCNIVCYKNLGNWDAYYTSHDLVATEAVDATCEEDGNIAYYTCSRCGAIFIAETDDEGNVTYTEVESEADLIVAATGHDYDYEHGTWTWAEDYSSATYTVVCLNDSDHVLVYVAEVTSETNEDGDTVYVATITADDENDYTDTVTIEVEDEEETTDSSTEDTDESSGVDTGDTTNVAFWIALAGLSFFALGKNVIKKALTK